MTNIANADRRRSSRKRFNFPGKIVTADGSPPLACVIADISETGAKLAACTAPNVPREFTLLVGGISDLRRQCLVVWRTGTHLGVRFAAGSRRRPARAHKLIGLV